MKKKILIFILLFISLQTHISAQSPKKYYSENKKHKFYFYWGYNRAAFLKSDIHFIGENHDITLYDVVAKDRPTPFAFKEYFAITKISIPQYDYRVGYYLTPNLGISVGLDHMKYVVKDNQIVKISGTIDSKASQKYAGVYDKKDIELTEDFLRYEHTDGLNLISLDIERLYPIGSAFKNKLRLNAQVGGGGGIVVPRTDARLFGRGANNPFHIAGWGIDAKTGLKLDLFKHFFLQTEVRTGFINLNDVLILHTESQRARQNIIFGEWYMLGGWYF
jgi:hypothetical protein